jgi:hypothetical protein
MDVKQIRDEIAKIDGLLATVDIELKKLAPINVEPPREVVEEEYMALLSALGGGSGNAIPFGSLEDESMSDAPDSTGLDAFTFFGLLQAFLDDAVVLSCLAKSFRTVVGVTSTQLEDAIVTADRITDLNARREILSAIIDRIVVEIEKGTIKSDLSLVAVCCQRFGSDFHPGMVNLLQLPGWEMWPVFIQIELAAYLAPHSEVSEFIPRFIECVIESAAGAEGSQLERNTKLQSPRTAFQLLSLLRQFRPDSVPLQTILSFAEKSAKSVSSQTIPGQVRHMSDMHHLCIELSQVEGAGDNSLSVWTSIVEKLGSGLGVYEVPGTLTSLSKIGIFSDNLFSNILSVKKRVSQMTKQDLLEFTNFLLLVGDKSSASAMTKFILDRRDLFVPSAEDPDISLLASVVELAAIASVDSGTIIPDAILLFKKYMDGLNGWFKAQDRTSAFTAISQLLITSSDPNAQQPSVGMDIDETESTTRMRRCLEALGFVADGSLLVSNLFVEGLQLDFAFPQHKTCVIIERNSIFNVSTKRASVCGRTAMKANIMAQRKSWKVIVVIPELYSDDKALISLIGEPLRKIAINSDFSFTGLGDLARLVPNQKIRILRSETLSLVDLGKALFQILKMGVHFHTLFVQQLVCGEQALGLLFNEFLATWVVKYKSDLTVRFDLSGPMSSEIIGKLLEGLNFSGNAAGGFGVIRLEFGLSDEVRQSVIASWNEQHASSQMKVIEAGSGESFSNNVVILS